MNTVDEVLVLWVIEITEAEHLLGLVVTFIGKVAGLGFDIDGEVLVFLEDFNETVSDLLLSSGGSRTTGND